MRTMLEALTAGGWVADVNERTVTGFTFGIADLIEAHPGWGHGITTDAWLNGPETGDVCVVVTELGGKGERGTDIASFHFRGADDATRFATAAAMAYDVQPG
jgi:hypothetical protein